MITDTATPAPPTLPPGHSPKHPAQKTINRLRNSPGYSLDHQLKRRTCDGIGVNPTGPATPLP